MAKKFRVESDTLGKVKIPENSLWGPQTQRSINNFKIGQPGSMPTEIIHSFAILKRFWFGTTIVVSKYFLSSSNPATALLILFGPS